MTHSRRRRILRRAALIIAFGLPAAALGTGLAWAVSSAATTGTNVSCATATLPAHTVGVDGAAVDTISGTSTQNCNTVTYTIPTSTETTTVTASPTTSTTATTSSTTTSSTTTTSQTTTTSGSAVVPAAPSVVAVPSGGWRVEYADAFGSCLTDPLTKCTAGYARSDNTMEGIQQANGFGNSNEKGVAALEPSEIDVTNQGLDLRCDKTANLGDVFSCGASRALNTRGYATHPFNWSFAANRHYVLQYSWQLPDNVAHMMDPAVWETGVSWAWEIDNPECWGYGFGADSPSDHGWYGKSCGGIAVPKDTGGGTGNLQYTIGTTPNVPVDPTAALHTDTIDFVDSSSGTLTATFYIDGAKVGSHSYSTFSSSTGKLILASGMRLNKACGCITTNFPSGGTDMLLRYVAMYEPASAGNAGTNGPIVVPGTAVQ